MPETVVRCPACRIGIKIKAVPPGKKAFACPKCRKAVPYPQPEPEPEDEELLDVEPADDEENEEDQDEEPPPSRRRRSRREDPEDEPEDDVDQDEEEEEPRRRKKKKKKKLEPRPYMWGVGLGGGLLIAVLTLLFFRLLNGPEGFPPPQDGPPIVKPIVLGFIVIVGLVVLVTGTHAMVTQKITLREYFLTVKVSEEKQKGTQATITGAGLAFVGSGLIGLGLYGLMFNGFN